MAAQFGRTPLGRYWITLGDQTIWDYPKDFVGTFHSLRANLKFYPYDTDVSMTSDVIREYIDTPKEELLTKNFETDLWGLVDILRAADKRVGSRRLSALEETTQNQTARKVVEARQRLAKGEESAN
jgi:hypothetical protein